jgi:F-type H+-transporting ATPase subunit a
MEKIEHPLWIVQAIGALSGRPVPDYLVMAVLVVAFLIVLALVARAGLSVERPGRLQIVLEDGLSSLLTLMDDFTGGKGARYVSIVGSVGLFILIGNLMGLLPGLMSPTSNINVTLGCALTVFVYYHIQGIRAQGVGTYLKHFAVHPGAPVFIAPIMLPIEIISHISRVLSLSLRLFGNIFGEDLVILILASIVPFVVPLPMMFLGVITGGLQAFIFVMLTTIYLGGAVATEHDQHS